MSTYDTAGQVLEVVRDLQAPLQSRRADQARMRSLIYQQHSVSIPEAYRATALQVKNPKPFKTVKHWTDTVTKDPPQVNRPAVPTARKAATYEKFMEAAWHKMQEDAKRNLYVPFMWSLVANGESWLKIYEQTKSFWAPYYQYSRATAKALDAKGLDEDSRRSEYRRRTEDYKQRPDLLFPIVMEYVSPASIAYLRGSHGLTAVAETKKIPYHEAVATFRKPKDAPWGLVDGKIVPEAAGLGIPEGISALGSATELTLTELWLCDEVYYVLEGVNAEPGHGVLVRSVKHGYGNPQTRCLYGPYQLAEGIQTDDSDPRFSSLGLLFATQNLHPALDSLLTMRQNGAYLFAFPSLSEDSKPGEMTSPEQFQGEDDNEAPDLWNYEPGRKYRNLRFVDPPKLSVDLNVAINDLRQMVEEDAPSAVLGGSPGDSGYQDHQAIWQANLSVNSIIQGAEKCLAESFAFIARIIATKIKEPVHVYGELPPEQGQKSKPGWLTLGPDDLPDGDYGCTVTFKSDNPASNVITTRTQIEMLGATLTDWDSAVEATGQNPDEVELRQMIHQGKEMLKPQIIEEAVMAATGKAQQEAMGAEQQMDAEAMQTGAVRQGLSQQPDVATPGQGMPIQPPGPNGTPAIAAHLPGGG